MNITQVCFEYLSPSTLITHIYFGYLFSSTRIRNVVHHLADLRVYVLEFLEQPLVFPTNEFLVPYHLVPRGIKFRVFASQRLVLGDVRMDQLAQLRALHLGQFIEIHRWRCHGYQSFACKRSMRITGNTETEFLIFGSSWCNRFIIIFILHEIIKMSFCLFLLSDLSDLSNF